MARSRRRSSAISRSSSCGRSRSKSPGKERRRRPHRRPRRSRPVASDDIPRGKNGRSSRWSPRRGRSGIRSWSTSRLPCSCSTRWGGSAGARGQAIGSCGVGSESPSPWSPSSVFGSSSVEARSGAVSHTDDNDGKERRGVMKTMRLLLLVILAVAMARSGAAEEPDAELIAKITGLKPDVKNGIAKVTVPRGDLGAVIDGAKMQPFQGLTSWAAFQAAGDKTIVMGDMTLTEPQVNPAMSAALDNGLQVTALHNHFFFDRPHVFFMHIGGVGTTEQLATGVRKALDAANAAQRGTGFGGVSIPAKSAIDPKPLETILGASAQAKDGVAKFSFGQKTSMHGTEVGEAMGVNTWAAFAGSQRAAVVDGELAVLEDA